jgi:hypothetical protein
MTPSNLEPVVSSAFSGRIRNAGSSEASAQPWRAPAAVSVHVLNLEPGQSDLHVVPPGNDVRDDEPSGFVRERFTRHLCLDVAHRDGGAGERRLLRIEDGAGNLAGQPLSLGACGVAQCDESYGYENDAEENTSHVDPSPVTERPEFLRNAAVLCTGAIQRSP